MRRRPDRSARSRAVLAVAALYGLLLQTFLVSLLPVAPAPGPDGAICAQHDPAPADDGLPCPQHACCIAAQAAQPLAGPAAAQASVAAPWRREVPQVWRPADTRAARAPPDPAVSSRGPPTA